MYLFSFSSPRTSPTTLVASDQTWKVLNNFCPTLFYTFLFLSVLLQLFHCIHHDLWFCKKSFLYICMKIFCFRQYHMPFNWSGKGSCSVVCCCWWGVLTCSHLNDLLKEQNDMNNVNFSHIKNNGTDWKSRDACFSLHWT